MSKPNRQGDLKITRVDKLPDDCTLSKSKTLAYGEGSGHHHTLIPLGNANVQMHRMLDRMFFEVKGGSAVLVHTDEPKIDRKSIDKLLNDMITRVKDGQDFHLPQTFDDGTYEVEVEKEYNPFTKELTRVVD